MLLRLLEPKWLQWQHDGDGEDDEDGVDDDDVNAGESPCHRSRSDATLP